MGFECASLLCVVLTKGGVSCSLLFFDCIFSRSVWTSNLLRRNLVSRSRGNWDFKIAWARGYCQWKNFRASLFKLSLVAAVYHICLLVIVACIRGRVCSWVKCAHSSQNARVCCN